MQVPVAGIDVGKNFSEMALLTPNNEIYQKIKIYHRKKECFNKSIDILKKAEKEFKAKPHIVMESTGHYFKILFNFFTNNGYKVSVINPIQTNCIKNLSVRKVKNDKIDARRLAIIYRLGEVKTSIILRDNTQMIKTLCRQYYKITDECTVYKNRIIGIVDQLMLNFDEVFSDICSNTALTLLYEYPTPDNILKANKEELIKLIASISRRGMKWATEKYERLCLKANEFKFLSLNDEANITILRCYIDILRTLEYSKDKIYKQILDLVESDRSESNTFSRMVDLLCTIPEIGIISAVTLLAEMGDFQLFKSPDKLVAYFGVDASVNQSGEFRGTENHISKRGSHLARRVLYMLAKSSIGKKSNGELRNPILHEFYGQKCVSKPKKVAQVAVMRKLICFIFAVLRDKKPFELRKPEEHQKQIRAKSSTAA